MGPAYANKTLEFCAPGDAICAGTVPPKDQTPHYQYGVNGMADRGAAFALGLCTPSRTKPNGAP